MSDIVERLRAAFGWVEERGMYVGDVWLHPNQGKELFVGHPEVFDREVCDVLLRAVVEKKRAVLLGYIFGARVFQSENILENHVALVPDGWDVKMLDRASCMPF
jgi:hypothetical protein